MKSLNYKNNNILNQITICILSIDREKDLKKKILFYKKKKVRLLILDQSQNSIKKFCKINLNKNSYYLHRPHLNYLKRFILIKKFIKTKYFMLQADDDFFFLKSIKKSLLFLEKYNNYVLVSGKVFSFNFYKKNFFLKEIYTTSRNIKFNDSSTRLKSMLDHSFFNIYYGVGRTKFLLQHIDVLKKNYTLYKDDLHKFHELQYLIISSITGKIKILNNIFYLRVGYNNRLPFPMSSTNNLQFIVDSSKTGYLDPFIKNILKSFQNSTVVDQIFLRNLIENEYSRRSKARLSSFGFRKIKNFIFNILNKLFYPGMLRFIKFYLGKYGDSIDKLPYSMRKEIQTEINLNKLHC